MPVIDTVRVAVELERSVHAVLDVIRTAPIVSEALIEIDVADPAVVPAPSTIKTSDVFGVVLPDPVLSAAVFQFAGVFQSAPLVPTQ